MLGRDKLRRFNWVGIPDPKIPETVFKSLKWEPLSIERSENADIKDKLHKMFFIKDAKKLGGKKGAAGTTPPLNHFLFHHLPDSRLGVWLGCNTLYR